MAPEIIPVVPMQAAEAPSAVSPSVLCGWNGLANTGYNPANASIAAGPKHAVQTVNSSMVIYDKKTGAKLQQKTLKELFPGFVGGDLGVFDPSCLYDDITSRYVIAGHARDLPNKKGYVNIAVSNTSDPTAGWTIIPQIEVSKGGLYWPDNGKMGFNADAWVFAANLVSVGSEAGPASMVIIVIDKTNGTYVPIRKLYQNWAQTGYVCLVPARMHGSKAGDPMWFVQTFAGGASELLVVRMDSVLIAPTLTKFTLPCQPYAPSMNPPQPGGTVMADDCRTLNVEWNRGKMVAAWNSSVGTDAAAAWIEFRAGNGWEGEPLLMQQGVINFGSPTYMPSIAVDGDGNIGLTYLQSSATEFVSMYVTARMPYDGEPGMLQKPVCVAAGTQTMARRVGDWSGISPDPDEKSFWATNEYGKDFWSTWIYKLSLDPKPIMDDLESRVRH